MRRLAVLPLLLPASPRNSPFPIPFAPRAITPESSVIFFRDTPVPFLHAFQIPFAVALREQGFKINCLGSEPELPIQTYNTKGNWKELDLIKRGRNEAKREGIVICEETIESVNRDELNALSAQWIGTKKVNDREIWIYARRPVFEFEEDVRKFVAYDREGRVAGFIFYDPMYRDGKVIGYAANISRCNEKRFGRLATAIHMEAMERFKPEGKEVWQALHLPF